MDVLQKSYDTVGTGQAYMRRNSSPLKPLRISCNFTFSLLSSICSPKVHRRVNVLSPTNVYVHNCNNVLVAYLTSIIVPAYALVDTYYVNGYSTDMSRSGILSTMREL
ncbi:hypothetical protein NpPPO83_00009624 [Neofusicoccum parvum]|uniref:Uncharacterized protein n=1 Tax=Neofusicoccum parvum TaxID=310453 RepID=A0ACB5S1I3_9PEZI|nr:hypothetical protein NpPPO83_00009624 [Neofusicoccum parvum]